MLAPPAGVEERVLEGVRSDLADREALSVFADLFGSGWATARLILGDDEDPQRG